MPVHPTDQLSAAIESLYTTFQHYPLPASTNPCPCCHPVDSERRLYSRPLRELTPKDLAPYANDALLTWGSVNEFKHFLPRVFEIAVFAERFTFADAEIVFAKLSRGEWLTWPQREQASIQAFLMALWRAALEQPPAADPNFAPEVETWLCCLAQAASELLPYLNEWLDSHSSAAAWNLSAMIYRTGMPRSRPVGINAFWAKHMDQAKQVSEWLHSKAVRNKLDRAAEMYINEPFAEELLAAASVVS